MLASQFELELEICDFERNMKSRLSRRGPCADGMHIKYVSRRATSIDIRGYMEVD